MKIKCRIFENNITAFFVVLLLIARQQYKTALVVVVGGGVRGSAVGWGTAQQAGRSRVRFPLVFWIFYLHNPSSRTMALGSTQHIQEMIRNIYRVIKTAVASIMCRLSWSQGALTYRNRQGLYRDCFPFGISCRSRNGCSNNVKIRKCH